MKYELSAAGGCPNCGQSAQPRRVDFGPAVLPSEPTRASTTFATDNRAKLTLPTPHPPPLHPPPLHPQPTSSPNSARLRTGTPLSSPTTRSPRPRRRCRRRPRISSRPARTSATPPSSRIGPRSPRSTARALTSPCSTCARPCPPCAARPKLFRTSSRPTAPSSSSAHSRAPSRLSPATRPGSVPTATA